MKIPPREKPFEEYVGTFIGLSTTGSQIVNYGKLVNYSETSRIFTLNPFKGQEVEKGKLVVKLIEGNHKVEIPGNQGIDIFPTDKKTIEKYCENNTIGLNKDTSKK